MVSVLKDRVFLYKATMALATSMSALPILVVHKPPRVREFTDLKENK
jgi:hypothetical protein